jgi:hypothetical protein
MFTKIDSIGGEKKQCCNCGDGDNEMGDGANNITESTRSKTYVRKEDDKDN